MKTDENKEYQDKIVDRIKNMIIANDFMSYGEKRAFEIFLYRLNNEGNFEEAVGELLRALNNLTKSQKNILSSRGEQVFKELGTNYSPRPERGFYYIVGDRTGAKISNLGWLIALVILIVIIFLLFSGKLNSILSFLNKL